MQNQLEFAASIAEINRCDAVEKQIKINDKLQEHNVKAPATARKLESKARDITGITAPELC